MKKLIALFLALVMCLSLCGCGGSVGGNAGGNAGEKTPTEAEETESPFTNHPQLQYMYGEWVINSGYENDHVAFRTLIINEDGTCIVDGTSATWKISESTSESWLEIEVFSGAEMLCSAHYAENIDSLEGYEGDNDGLIGRACIGTYTNLSRSK